MTYPFVKDNSPMRTGQCSLRSQNGIAVFDETYEYLIVTDSKTESYANVIDATNAPLIGQTISPSGYGICKSKSATRWTENPYYWTLTAEFSSEVDEKQDSQNPTQDPLTWIPIYETKFERIQEVVTKDKSGASIANSAGQPFETGLTISRFIPVWEFFQFESATLSDEAIIERNEVVNSGVFKGRAAKTLLLTVASSVVGFYYGRKIRFSKYQLRYNSKKWTNKRLDVGTVYKSGSDLLPYTDKYNNVILGSLNGSGGKQAVGTAPAVREFDQYEEKSFSFLRI